MIEEKIDRTRRRLLGAAGSGVLLSTVGGVAPHRARAEEVPPLRWGIVGTGMIANSMANMIKVTGPAELAAVSSRRMDSANAFANRHGADKAFDSWREMAAWDGIDAVYVATPTSVREEICIAAANSGKHVLGEKPFASLPSVRRIADACRDNGVGFMDGTHFVHHPRTFEIRAKMNELVGWPWSVASAFQFPLSDRGNIRYNPELEPMGAIGDAGWYNMRAAVEYLSPNVEISEVSAYLRRDEQTGAAISGSGTILFNDRSTTTWNCGFDSGAVIMDLRITGAKGTISIDNFLGNDADGSASYLLRRGGWGRGTSDSIRVAGNNTSAALMFEHFAVMIANGQDDIERSIRATERTQQFLDAIWISARANEKSG